MADGREDMPMRSAPMRRAAAMALWLAGCLCPAEGLRAADAATALPCERAGFFEFKTVGEPSGLCYHPGRKTIFGVDDGGDVFEFSADGRLLAQKTVRQADMEGIAVDPATGRLYVAIEGAESILEVDPATLKAGREFAVPRAFHGKTMMKAGGQGIEAIAFAPDRRNRNGGTFFVANQSFNLNDTEDASVVFEVEAPIRARDSGPAAATVLRFFTAPAVDISGLCYDAAADCLYAISDATDRLMLWTRSGEVLREWALPGENQEGIAVDPDGFMYIAQDSGGVLKLKPDWAAMLAGLQPRSGAGLPAADGRSNAAPAPGGAARREHVFVSGVVQGVGFRDFTRRRVAALELDVRGWVRNLPDGRVEIVAEGPAADLEKLASEVSKGPPAARVDKVDRKEEPCTGEFQRFEIRY
jgi:acylphosphatase